MGRPVHSSTTDTAPQPSAQQRLIDILSNMKGPDDERDWEAELAELDEIGDDEVLPMPNREHPFMLMTTPSLVPLVISGKEYKALKKAWLREDKQKWEAEHGTSTMQQHRKVVEGGEEEQGEQKAEEA
ncbi:hypothetical protein JCM10207_005015 [Rhodosporidiobolus poonsookiae]